MSLGWRPCVLAFVLSAGASPASLLAQASAPSPIFVDRAAALGLDFVHEDGATGERYFAEMAGPGAALADFDGDGDLDAYLLQGFVLGPEAPTSSPPDRLFRNELIPAAGEAAGLRFTDVTDRMGVVATGYGMGIATGDVDNDGDVDVYLANFGPNQLLRNLGGLVFDDITAASGTDDRLWGAGAAFVDVDADGWLDLYLVNYVDFTIATHTFCPSPTGVRDYCGPTAYPPQADRLFRNLGVGEDGVVRFEDATAALGFAVPAGAGLGVVTADVDDNGWIDLYVANDQGPNRLFLNQGPGTDGPRFLEDGALAGVAVNVDGEREASMGVDAGDVDGDGDVDLVLTHLRGQTNTLYRNVGGGLFEDASQGSNVGPPSWPDTGFGAVFLDVDNDGDLDLATVNGMVAFFGAPVTGSLAQTDRLYRNRGDGTFDDVTAQAGPSFDTPTTSRGTARGDVDNDGDPDLLVVDNGGPPRMLINQVGQDRAWLGLRLVGGTPARDQLGARATLEGPRVATLVRRVRTDGSYASAHDPRVLFGLGDSAAKAYRVRVRWPDGEEEVFDGVAPGRYRTLVRGSGEPPPSVDAAKP